MLLLSTRGHGSGPPCPYVVKPPAHGGRSEYGSARDEPPLCGNICLRRGRVVDRGLQEEVDVMQNEKEARSVGLGQLPKYSCREGCFSSPHIDHPGRTEAIIDALLLHQVCLRLLKEACDPKFDAISPC